MQIFTLCREQGRLSELEPVVRSFVQKHPTASTWRPGLALIYRELGLREAARTAFEPLAQRDFADLPRDALWATCIAYLAEVCAFLDDADHAATLYRLLLPYARYCIVTGGGVACYGSAARYLGLLAATMGHWDASARHFDQALALNARMGARPWLAHTQHDYAVMLLARGRPEERARARGLLEESLSIARELGMHALQARLTTQMAPSETPPKAATAYLDGLSRREIEVLRLMALGKSNRAMADQLCISLGTVATHVHNILTKTGSANRTEAAAAALRQGLVEG